MTQKTKLIHYQIIKRDLQLEKYLNLVKTPYHRKLFTLFRIGAYPLRVETGRWHKDTKERRFCMKCLSGQVEDEPHFLFECDAYDTARRKLYFKLKNMA